MSRRIPWSRAWIRAQSGTGGFYAREWPADHFATSLDHPGPIAEQIVTILHEVDRGLGSPPRIDLVDVGSGSGTLLAATLSILEDRSPDLLSRVRAAAIDIRGRPPDLDARIDWHAGVAPGALAESHPGGIRGLVVAHEFLDDIPVEIVVGDGDGRVPRLLLVDPRDGSEEVGPALDDAAECRRLGVDGALILGWLRRWWWPVRGRAESGHLRDHAWAGICARLAAGTALAVDYAHERSARTLGVFAGGSLSGYRDGRGVPAVPDGSVNLTAHVALDSCAAAVEAGTGAAVRTLACHQRDLLAPAAASAESALAGARVDGSVDLAGHIAALERVNRLARLRDPGAGGSITWLRQDIALPSTLPGWPPHRG